MLCHFVPPYLVNALATGGAGGSSGPLTLRLDDELRARRAEPPRALHVRRVAGTSARVIHSAQQTEQLPGYVVRTGGGPPTHDLAADEAYESSGHVWDLFHREFHRSSVDGDGTPLSVTVHYGQDYDNAFWDGRQLVFGDGDGEIFERFTKPLDVLAHEFAHGVTQFTAGLNYRGQPGALNESVSDVFAAMTRQRLLGQTAAEADWLIGVGLFAAGVQATALRSMLAPGTAYDDPRLGRDRQVGHWSDYVETEEDGGGVHINSGIPNRAFAEAARAIGGHCWEQPGQIWYDALTSGEVGAQTDFAGFAQATISSARRLFPGDPDVAARVQAAWATVGVLAAPATSGSEAIEPTTTADQLIAVSRSGGFTGLTRSGELDLDADPAGDEIRTLLSSIDLGLFGGDATGADRFTYTVDSGPHHVIVPEQELTPELHRVVQLVLGAGRPGDPARS